MVMDKVIAAKISAYYTGWADPDECAQCAENGIMSIQRNLVTPYVPVGFFAMGKGDKEFPIDKLTDLSYAHNLVIALPYDAFSPEIDSALEMITRQRHRIEEIDEVVDVGQDTSTGETKYYSNDRGVDDLEAWRKWANATGIGVTLSQVDEFAKRAKEWKVSYWKTVEDLCHGLSSGKINDDTFKQGLREILDKRGQPVYTLRGIANLIRNWLVQEPKFDDKVWSLTDGVDKAIRNAGENY